MMDDSEEAFDSWLRGVAAAPHIIPLGRETLHDRFVLTRRLGEGGFGVVYEARDLLLERQVALKLLRQPEASWLLRFKREFRSLQGLLHPNLVELHELFGTGSQWFFTMDLVDGGAFLERVRPAPGTGLNEPSLRGSLRQLLSGLAVLHAAGKVHRDIKPANVLVTATGQTVIVDFGLVADAHDPTETEGMGTPAYMAPEQISGADVGPSADLYAVGVMLYEALTGRLPFAGTKQQVLAQKRFESAPRAAAAGALVPPDLDELCARLLERDPRQRSNLAEALQLLGSAQLADAVEDGNQVATATPEFGNRPRVFVGRSRDLERLDAVFRRSQRGELVTVWVCGESGIGKTSLVHQFAQKLQGEVPDLLLLEGRCREREAIPYKAIDGIVDALIARLQEMSPELLEPLLPAPGTVLPTLFPELLRVPGFARRWLPNSRNSSQVDLRQLGFRELRELLARLALRHPLLVCIDDLQWADDDGLLALGEVLRRPDAPRLLFVATLREQEASSNGVLARLHAMAAPAERMALEGLPLDEASELATRLLDGAEGRGIDPLSIATEAAGHPLFLEELARHAALGHSQAPELRLDDAIWARLAGLDASAAELAELVAASGKPLVGSVAATAANLSRGALLGALRRLRAANLVHCGDGRLTDAIEPYHDRVRVAILTRIAPDRTRALHRALAQALDAQPSPDVEALALHWREAGDRVRASRYARLAGELAARAFAFERAAEWFREALAAVPEEDRGGRRELEIQLGDALSWAGRGVQAAVHFEAAATGSPSLEALELRRRAAEQLLRSGRVDRGLRASRSVLAAVGMRIPASRLETLVLLAYYGLRVRARGLALRSQPRARLPLDHAVRFDACWSIAMALALVNPFLAFVFQKRALLLALDAGDLHRSVRALVTETGGSAALGTSSWRRTEMLLGRLRELAEQSGTPQSRALMLATHGTAYYLSGFFKKSVDAFGPALGMLDDGALGLVHEGVTSRVLMVYGLAMLGRFAELRRQQEQGLRDALARNDVYAAVSMRVGCPSLTWLLDDRPDLAERQIEEAMQEWSTAGFHIQHFNALMGRLWAKSYAGDAESAYRIACDAMRATRRSLIWRMQIPRVRALYTRGAAALELLRRGGGDRRLALRQVSSDARAIEMERCTWTAPFAQVLYAGLALVEPTRLRAEAVARARSRLIAARDGFAAADMLAYAGAASERLSRLCPDLAADELDWRRPLVAEGVVSPERLLRVLVPELPSS
jgi:eukaryotic-like serine/threonine-protein kinase